MILALGAAAVTARQGLPRCVIAIGAPHIKFSGFGCAAVAHGVKRLKVSGQHLVLVPGGKGVVVFVDDGGDFHDPTFLKFTWMELTRWLMAVMLSFSVISVRWA